MRFTRHITLISTLALVSCLPLVSTACGFLFSHGPPAGHEQMSSFDCTESNTGPIIDIVWAGLNVLGAIRVASDPDAYENSGEIIAVGLSWGAISGAAAAVGFDKSKKCRAARRQLAERQAQGLVPLSAPLDATAPAAVVVTPPSDTLRAGVRLQLIATAHSSSGATVVDRAFYWTSSNDAIASVSGAGLVTANAPGTVVIAARTGTLVGTASVVVVVP